MHEGFPDRALLALCERFSLWVRQGGGLPATGRPLPSGPSSGMDFEGYAEYAPGMDLRHLDWNVYARIGEFHVRQFEDEGAGLVVVFVDASGSMGVGRKWQVARDLAAAITFTGLSELHQVLLAGLSDGRLVSLPISGGLGHAPVAFDFLRALKPSGSTRLGPAVAGLATGGVRGRAVLISDFLDPDGPEAAVDTLTAQGFEVDLLRLTAVGEFELPPGGHAMADPEGPLHVVAPVGAEGRRALSDRIRAFRQRLPAIAVRRGAQLIEIDCAVPLAELLARYFSRAAAHQGVV